MLKACSVLAVFALLASFPRQANASLFGLLGGNTAVADTTNADDLVVNNSQTVALLEPSINPDTNGAATATDSTVVTIDSDDALMPNLTPIGPTSDLEKYATSATINTYTVKKGDTLSGIAKKFNTTEAAITYSNTNLKKSDLLKAGQKLVILPLNSVPTASIKPTPIVTTVTKPETDDTKKVVVVAKVADTSADDTTVPTFTINTDTASPQATVTPVVDSTPVISTSSTVGTTEGNYIWPFSPGVGRVSQGLHDDQAIDFAAPLGTPIHAVQSGTVYIVHPTGYNGGFGKYVVINFTDGRQAIFGHMSKTLVVEGQIVNQGDVIGLVGSTGDSTGPHVHIGFHGTTGSPYASLKVNDTGVTND